MSLETFHIWLDSKLMKTNCQVLYQNHLPTWSMLDTCKWISKPNASFINKTLSLLLFSSFCIFAATWTTTHSMVNFHPNFQTYPIFCICEYWSHFFYNSFMVYSISCILGCISKLTFCTSFHSVCLLTWLCRLLDNNNLSGYLPPEFSMLRGLAILYVVLHVVYISSVY